MNKKSVNKIIVWAIIWSAIVGLWKFTKSKKGKSFFHRFTSKMTNALSDFKTAIWDVKNTLFKKRKK